MLHRNHSACSFPAGFLILSCLVADSDGHSNNAGEIPEGTDTQIDIEEGEHVHEQERNMQSNTQLASNQKPKVFNLKQRFEKKVPVKKRIVNGVSGRAAPGNEDQGVLDVPNIPMLNRMFCCR
jgi:hypothetical protein